MNCVYQCISELCYDEVYSTMPLEDGEIDTYRYRLFTTCVRKELQTLHNKKFSSAGGRNKDASVKDADILSEEDTIPTVKNHKEEY